MPKHNFVKKCDGENGKTAEALSRGTKHAVFLAAVLASTVFAVQGALADQIQIDASKYGQHFKITFSGYNGSETLKNFPVLVKLSQAKGFMYDKCKVSNGGDLRFADAEGNLLSSEVDTWTENGESLVWVKVPSLNADTVITAYYGSTSPDMVTATDVWSENYAAVWHLNESAAPLAESTGKATSFSCPSGGVAPTYAAGGVVGKAVDFLTNDDGTTAARLVAADCDALDGFEDFTVEFWTYQESFRNDQLTAIMAKRNWSGNEESWFVYQNNSPTTWQNLALGYGTDGTSANRTTCNAGKRPSASKWVYQALVRNMSDDTWAWYWDGATSPVKSDSGNNTQASVYAGSATLKLGGGGNQYSFPGSIDEVRISSVKRSVDWITATHDTIASDNFCSFVFDAAWDDYSHRFPVSFPGVSDGVSLTNFPVLVRIAEYDDTTGKGIRGFDYDDCLILNGGDLRFADAEGNLLASEVDTWNTSGESLVWVSVPELTASTKITAYYGCAAPHAVTASDVWTNGFNAVWHLGESAAPLAESTGNATPFKKGTNAPTYATNGVVGCAVDFSANDPGTTGSRLVADDADALDGFEDFTIEFWTYQESFRDSTEFACILSKRYGYNNQESWFAYQNNGTAPNNVLAFSKDGTSNRTAGNANMHPDANTWTHQAFQRKMSTGRVEWYFDGVRKWYADAQSKPATVQVYAGAAPLYLGGGVGQNSFPGSIDEVRISSVVRDAAWIKATHDTIADNATFTCYGAARSNTKGLMLIIR